MGVRFRSCIRMVAVVAMGAVLLTAPARAQGVVEEARASLPAALRQSGVLKVATTFQWPPFSIQQDSGELDGIDISIMRLLAAKMGLKAEFTDITRLPVILGGVETGRFDAAVGQMGITADRVKIVDFVPYLKSGFALLVRRGRTGLSINDLCGHTLAITQGSSQVTLVDALSTECVQAGKPPIATDVYPSANNGQMAVANGRGEGFITGAASAVYNARGNPQLEVAPGTLDRRTSMCGIVVSRTNGELRRALSIALESAVADGSYQAVLDRFDIADSRMTLEQMRTAPSVLADAH